jgi:hypothetical protein
MIHTSRLQPPSDRGIGGGGYGIIGIKDTYVVCKYVKKALLELGFMGFMGFMGFRHLEEEAVAVAT